MKIFLRNLFLLLFVFSMVISCASFGIYGSVDYIDNQQFVVTISVPPIAGGGSVGGNFQGALKLAAKEVQKKDCNLFVIFQQSHHEQLRTWNSDFSGQTYRPATGTASTSTYMVIFSLPESEEEFRGAVGEYGLQVYSARHITGR